MGVVGAARRRWCMRGGERRLSPILPLPRAVRCFAWVVLPAVSVGCWRCKSGDVLMFDLPASSGRDKEASAPCFGTFKFVQRAVPPPGNHGAFDWRLSLSGALVSRPRNSACWAAAVTVHEFMFQGICFCTRLSVAC